LAWPVAADLSAYLAEQGRPVPSTDALDSALASAIAAFEAGTSWIPFLGVSGSNLFDPLQIRPLYDGWTLELGCGLVSLTSLYIGWDGSTGTQLTENTDFYLGPPARVGYTWPYTEVRFYSSIGGLPRSIRLTGTWGFSSTISDDVAAAILQGAAAFAITNTSTAAALANKIKEGPVELDFKDGSQVSGYWQVFKAAIGRYQRL